MNIESDNIEGETNGIFKIRSKMTTFANFDLVITQLYVSINSVLYVLCVHVNNFPRVNQSRIKVSYSIRMHCTHHETDVFRNFYRDGSTTKLNMHSGKV